MVPILIVLHLFYNSNVPGHSVLVITMFLCTFFQNINLVTDGEREPVTCRCLDCDTVTQAKQKALNAIYLNTPFSNRPSVYDVDLGEFGPVLDSCNIWLGVRGSLTINHLVLYSSLW